MQNPDVEKILGEAPADKCFICQDGCLHKTLTGLQQCLSHMDEATYSHHVRPGNNDFSNWVRDVMGDWELADQIAAAKNARESARVVKQRLDWLLKGKLKATPAHGHDRKRSWVTGTPGQGTIDRNPGKHLNEK